MWAAMAWEPRHSLVIAGRGREKMVSRRMRGHIDRHRARWRAGLVRKASRNSGRVSGAALGWYWGAPSDAEVLRWWWSRGLRNCRRQAALAPPRLAPAFQKKVAVPCSRPSLFALPLLDNPRGRSRHGCPQEREEPQRARGQGARWHGQRQGQGHELLSVCCFSLQTMDSEKY